MQSDAGQVQATTHQRARPKRDWRRNAPPPKLVGKKITLKSIDDLDLRTRAAVRAKNMIASIQREYGTDLTVSQQQLAQHAALLSVMIEDLSAEWLLGNPIDFTNYSVLINTQRRVLASL